MLEWVNDHGLLVLVLFFLYSNVIGALPSAEEIKAARPDIGGLKLLAYKHGKQFLELTAANAARVFPRLRGMGNGENKNV